MNKRLKIFFGLFFFIYFSVYLFSLTFTNKPAARAHERVIVAVASPLQKLVNFTYDKISSIFSDYIWLVGKAKENEELQKQLGNLRQRVVQMNEFSQENERLRGLLGLSTPSKYSPIFAERIAFGSNQFERSIRVNKGKNDNVVVGMPVVDAQGVVGQVAEVFDNYSNLILLTDKSSAIDVIVQRTRSRGILKGFTPHQLSFEFLSVDDDLQVGDVVISSGLDGVYPDGIPVGVVSATGKQGRRLFLTATIDPYVKFSKLEEVRILSPKEKRDF